MKEIAVAIDVDEPAATAAAQPQHAAKEIAAIATDDDGQDGSVRCIEELGKTQDTDGVRSSPWPFSVAGLLAPQH